jgi:hypothetical protein
LTNIQVVGLNENYLEDKLIKDEQELILKLLGRVFHDTSKE